MSDFPLLFKIVFGIALILGIISVIFIPFSMVNKNSSSTYFDTIGGVTLMLYILTLIGFLQGIQSGFGMIIRYGWESFRTKILMLLYTSVNFLTILYEILSSIFKPTTELLELVKIINGFGIWGSFGIILVSISILIDVFFSHDADPEFSYASKFFLGLNIFNFSIYFLSGLFHINIPLPYPWILPYWNFWIWVGFSYIAYGYYTGKVFI